jgi:Icc-related predicted phosphoesterase
MKILAIGDFHGTFPAKFRRIIKEEKIDIVVSIGDYFPFSYRKLWFEHCYRTDKELWEVIGKKKMKELVLKDIEKGKNALQALNRLKIPVITVVGNIDKTNLNDQYSKKNIGKSKWEWPDQDFFSKIIKGYENIKRFDYSYIKIGEYTFIGAYGGSSPGSVKSKAYRKHKKLLDKLLKKFRKENREGKVVFVSHNVPYNTKLDKAGKDAHPKVRGKHLGSKLIRRTIDKWRPALHIGGHMHEGKGKDKIKRTLCVNPGAAHDGEAAIIDLSGKKPKIKFIT